MEKHPNNCIYLFSRLYSKQAFSFIEIILVVIIMSVVCAVSIPHLSRAHESLLLENEAEKLAAVIRYAQSRSIIKQREYQLSFSEGFRKYWILEREPSQGFSRVSNRWGRTSSVAEKVEVFGLRDSFLFFSDGQMEKAWIKMCLKEDCLTISTQKERGRVCVFKEQKD